MAQDRCELVTLELAVGDTMLHYSLYRWVRMLP